jgi:hypothetical protein
LVSFCCCDWKNYFDNSLDFLRQTSPVQVTVTVCNFLISVHKLCCLNPNITLTFLYCFIRAFVVLWLSCRKLFQFVTITENEQNKSTLMWLESENNINSSSNCMLHSVFSIIFPWRVHYKLEYKCVPKKLVDSVTVIF